MRRTATMVGFGCWLIACGRDVPPEEAMRRMVTATCERVQACTPAFITTTWGDVATCDARSALGLAASLNLPGNGYTSSALLACADAIAGQSCDSLRTPNGAPPEACRIKGSLSQGTACTSHAQCQSGYCAAPQGGASCGVCRDRAQVGEPCKFAADCAYELACPQGVCVATSALGEPCDAARPCATAAMFCQMGICTAGAGEGADCDPMITASCDAGQGLYCLPPTRRCVKVVFADPGATCGQSSTGLTACSGGGMCSQFSSGVCVAPAADGASCTTGQRCQLPAQCGADGLCAVLAPASCGG